jgi:hypothetical protein
MYPFVENRAGGVVVGLRHGDVDGTSEGSIHRKSGVPPCAWIAYSDVACAITYSKKSVHLITFTNVTVVYEGQPEVIAHIGVVLRAGSDMQNNHQNEEANYLFHNNLLAGKKMHIGVSNKAIDDFLTYN